MPPKRPASKPRAPIPPKKARPFVKIAPRKPAADDSDNEDDENEEEIPQPKAKVAMKAGAKRRENDEDKVEEDAGDDEDEDEDAEEEEKKNGASDETRQRQFTLELARLMLKHNMNLSFDALTVDQRAILTKEIKDLQ